MNIYQFATAFLLLGLATTFAVPQEQVDPTKLKEKVSLTLSTQGTIQFKPQGDLLTEPKLIKGTGEKGEGVTVDFKTVEQFIMLTVKNRFAKAFRYRAAIKVKGRKEFLETSIIPVSAGLFGTETWQDPIEEIILFDFKLMDEKAE